MKHLRHLSFCLLLVMLLTVSAFAADVPESFVCENLNGQQRIVKTYVLPPSVDPDALREAPFDYDGYHYTWAYTTKEEHPFLLTKSASETVTVETPKNELTVILEQLAPTIEYDDGEYHGELSLDHTTLRTEAAGYETRRGSVSETKVIPNLASNDMSYVPATTVKNGKTLNLANVDWQVTGTALVGEELIPSQYQAVATYTGSSSYQAATGYVTTAEYKGEVTAAGIENITYVVVYTGSEIQPIVTEQAPSRGFMGGSDNVLLILPAMVLASGLICAAVYLILNRKTVYVYVPGSKPRDYKLIAKFRVNEDDELVIDISDLDLDPEGNVAVEIKRKLAKKIKGKTFVVVCKGGMYQYVVQNDSPGDWHEFNLETLEEVTS